MIIGKKDKPVGAGAFFLCVFFLLGQTGGGEPFPEKFIKVFFPNGKSITAELAVSDEEWARGLMFREKVFPDQGMLFVFEHVKPRNFVMKNTPISLDIIFIGKNGCVVHMAESTTPMSDTVYRSKGPVKYVVEVKAGFAKCFKIQKGTCIKWRRL